MSHSRSLAIGLGLAAVLVAVATTPASAATITGSIPGTATPGGTVTVTAAVVADVSGDITVRFESLGTGADAATLNVSTSPATTCAAQGATPPDSGVSCSWVGATAGDTLTLTAAVTIPATAAVGSTFDIIVATAGAPDPTLVPLEGTITVAAPVTPTQAPVPTAAPAGTAQAGAPAPVGLLVGGILGLVALAGVGTLTVVRSRARS